MYEKNRYYDKWGREKSPYVKYKDLDLYDQVKSEIDKLKKDGKLNGRVKTLPKRFLLTRRVA